MSGAKSRASAVTSSLFQFVPSHAAARPDRDDHCDRGNPTVAACLHVGRIQPDVGPFALQGPVEAAVAIAVPVIYPIGAAFVPAAPISPSTSASIRICRPPPPRLVENHPRRSSAVARQAPFCRRSSGPRWLLVSSLIHRNAPSRWPPVAHARRAPCNRGITPGARLPPNFHHDHGR